MGNNRERISMITETGNNVPSNESVNPKQEVKEIHVKRDIYLDPKRASELPWDTMCVL